MYYLHTTHPALQPSYAWEIHNLFRPFSQLAIVYLRFWLRLKLARASRLVAWLTERPCATGPKKREIEIERESLIQIYSCVESNNLVNYSAGDHKPYFRLLLAGLRPKPLMNFDAGGFSVYFRVLRLTISWLDWSWCWMCWKCNWFHLKRDAPCWLRVAPPYILVHVGKQNLPLPKKRQKNRETDRETDWICDVSIGFLSTPVDSRWLVAADEFADRQISIWFQFSTKLNWAQKMRKLRAQLYA